MKKPPPHSPLPEKTDSNGVTLMMEAAKHNVVTKIVETIEAGHDIDRADKAGYTALLHAVVAGHEEAALMLMFHKADLAKTNRAGESALHFAAEKQMHGVVTRWVQYHGPLDMQDKTEQRTPLMRAILQNDIYAAELLLRSGADFDQLKDKQGYTAEQMGLARFTGKDRGFFTAAIAARRKTAAEAEAERRRKIATAAHKLDDDVAAPDRARFKKSPRPPR